MSGLPKTLVLLNDELGVGATLRRLDRDDPFAGKRLREADYDRLLVSQSDSLSDALREAGLVGEYCTLIHLGSQVDEIDVLFAEIDSRTQAMRRFVIVEDKLCRNPEAHREVLGQILDYSMTLKELSLEEIGEVVGDGRRAWFQANQDLIHDALDQRKFLLLICSDQVRPSLIDYARHLSEEFPLERMELGLVSLSIYSDGKQHLLVPNVAGTLKMPDRSLVIKVEVVDSAGKPVSANISAEWHQPEEDAGRTPIQEGYLLDLIGSQSAEAREVAEYFLREALARGAIVDFRSAAASVKVSNAATHRPCTLFVITRRGTFYVGFFGRWEENAAVGPEVSEDYLDRLTAILGRSPRMVKGDLGGRRAVPLIEVGPKRHEVIEVIGQTLHRLRDAAAPEINDETL